MDEEAERQQVNNLVYEAKNRLGYLRTSKNTHTSNFRAYSEAIEALIIQAYYTGKASAENPDGKFFA